MGQLKKLAALNQRSIQFFLEFGVAALEAPQTGEQFLSSVPHIGLVVVEVAPHLIFF